MDLEYFSGADLRALVDGASRNAAWESERDHLIFEDFIKARKDIKPSINKSDIDYFRNIKEF